MSSTFQLNILYTHIYSSNLSIILFTFMYTLERFFFFLNSLFRSFINFIFLALVSGDRFEGLTGALQYGGVAGLRAASHAASATAVPAPARP